MPTASNTNSPKVRKKGRGASAKDEKKKTKEPAEASPEDGGDRDSSQELPPEADNPLPHSESAADLEGISAARKPTTQPPVLPGPFPMLPFPLWAPGNPAAFRPQFLEQLAEANKRQRLAATAMGQSLLPTNAVMGMPLPATANNNNNNNQTTTGIQTAAATNPLQQPQQQQQMNPQPNYYMQPPSFPSRYEEVATSQAEFSGAHHHHHSGGNYYPPPNPPPYNSALDPECRGEDDGSGETGGSDLGKKARLVWTQELHNRFINALSHLGLKNAVPKNILTLMNVDGMTRENVASHLQKYRLYLKKIGGYTERERVDAEELQKIHEQNVQQMAAQQAMQQHGYGGHHYGGPAMPGDFDFVQTAIRPPGGGVTAGGGGGAALPSGGGGGGSLAIADGIPVSQAGEATLIPPTSTTDATHTTLPVYTTAPTTAGIVAGVAIGTTAPVPAGAHTNATSLPQHSKDIDAMLPRYPDMPPINPPISSSYPTTSRGFVEDPGLAAYNLPSSTLGHQMAGSGFPPDPRAMGMEMNNPYLAAWQHHNHTEKALLLSHDREDSLGDDGSKDLLPRQSSRQVKQASPSVDDDPERAEVLVHNPVSTALGVEVEVGAAVMGAGGANEGLLPQMYVHY